MKSRLIHIAHQADAWLAKKSLRLKAEKPVLLILLFHELFLNQQELSQDRMFPHEWLTLDHFRQFVRYFLKANYRFVSPDDISNGLDPQKHHILISFDDGYYNNHRALKVLHEFEVPAVFSIATDYVLNPRAYWWDVHYREEKKAGKSFQSILSAQQMLKKMDYEQVEMYLKEAYGARAFEAMSDTDRPFSSDELRDFAREKYVHIGNHTRHHAILPHYEKDEMRKEIAGAQRDLRKICGFAPKFIAYPNGEASPLVVQQAREQGLEIGVIASLGKQNLPLTKAQYLQLDRYQIYGVRDIPQQCEMLRAEISLKVLYRGLRNATKTN